MSARPIGSLVTVQGARKWEAATDRYLLCLEVLGMSFAEDGEDVCDAYVEDLERRYEAVLRVLPKATESCQAEPLRTLGGSPGHHNEGSAYQCVSPSVR